MIDKLGNASKTSLPILALCALALIAVASPVIIFPVPALLDYPAHLAREGIIYDLLTQGRFSSMYQLHIAVIPNLGMEAVVLPLLFFGVPLEIAGRIFLVLATVLLGTGTVVLHRALFKKASLFPLLSFAFIFNPVFMFGFASYVLGTALLLHAFAWWLRAREKPVAAILPLLLLWAVALFFCHLMAVVFYVGLILSHEAGLALIERHSEATAGLFRALALLALPVAVVAFLYRLAPLSTAPQTLDVHSAGEILQQIPARLKALPYYLTAYSRPIDILVSLMLAGMLGLSAWLGRLRLSWPMLVPILGLVLVYALAPDKWAGTEYISYRIPMALLFLFFASVDVEWGRSDSFRRFLPATAVLGLIGLRTAAMLSAWAQADAQYRPMLQAMADLPSHSTIYTGVNYRESAELLRMPWSHLESYAAIRNTLFAKGIWADPTQNWITPTPRYAQLAKIRGLNNRVDANGKPRQGADMFAPALSANYDYLFAVRPELYQRPIPARVRLIARSSGTALFSLHDR